MISPVRVVAPTSVKRGRSSRIVRASGPSRSRCRAEVLHRRVQHLFDGAGSPWISSMNNTPPSSRLVRIAARSPARSSVGPLVGCMRAPISVAMIPAKVVFPRPGGPANSTWSTACPRAGRRGEHDLEVLAQAGLADELVEPARPQRRLLGRLGRIGRRAQQLLPHAQRLPPVLGRRRAAGLRRCRRRRAGRAWREPRRWSSRDRRARRAPRRVAFAGPARPRSRSGTSRRAFSSTSNRCAVRLPTPGTSTSTVEIVVGEAAPQCRACAPRGSRAPASARRPSRRSAPRTCRARRGSGSRTASSRLRARADA